ncbi:tyrosine- kinase ITK TSK-like protein [Labeo rohita]|uniref:Tyrosine-protein kinase n=1 Tax=Labeo rohita TaxID=84645 RepID=A0A498LW07_LABRO|nr:tyrosine- kinase ITK TSK-like protein [Labeo rohita]
MYPRVVLKETLYKKSQQKRRTSPCNYKERIFVLNTQDLTYFEHRPGKKPSQKGCIELSHIKCVEIVRSDVPIPCDYKYPFQIAHDSYYLYVFAPDNDCRLKWVRALKEAKPLPPTPDPANKDGGFMVRDSKHPGVYTVSIFSRAAGTNGEKYPLVKHYQIKVQREGEKVMYYLAEKYLFSTIPELIRYHQHNPADKWEIHPDELTLSEELGSGQFGLVWKGSWNDRQVAVKTVREGFMSEEEFKEEAQVMMKLSHSKLVQLYGVVTQRSPIYLVFEFMENGCLTEFLRARKGSFSQKVLLGMCLDVSEGMAYLESSNFIHRDLAARNCLVTEDNVVKIADFGMTRFVLDDQYTSSFGSKFPVRWSSPEVIKFQKYSSKSDVWSFGVFMWEVYSEGRMPYDSRSNAEVVETLNAGQRLLRPRLCPQSVYELMQWSWKEAVLLRNPVLMKRT